MPPSSGISNTRADLNPLTDAATAADYASKQPDRWLFVAALIVLLLFIGIAWRWIIADREKVSLRLTAMTDRHIEVTEKLAEVVANNTAVLNEVKKKL